MQSFLQNKDLRNRIGGFMFGLSGVMFGAFFIFLRHWINSAPLKPDPSHGQQFPHNEHGMITYFTAFQATSSALLFFGSALLGIIAIATLPKQSVVLRKVGKIPLGLTWKNDDQIGVAKSSVILGAAIGLIVIPLIGPLVVSFLNQHGIVLNL